MKIYFLNYIITFTILFIVINVLSVPIFLVNGYIDGYMDSIWKIAAIVHLFSFVWAAGVTFLDKDNYYEDIKRRVS